MGQTSERAFETYVEEILLTRGAWKTGVIADWDKERALFPGQITTFIQETQPKLWAQMKDLHGAGLGGLFSAVFGSGELPGSGSDGRHAGKRRGEPHDGEACRINGVTH
jgi:type I restriction enzyme R subunit